MYVCMYVCTLSCMYVCMYVCGQQLVYQLNLPWMCFQLCKVQSTQAEIPRRISGNDKEKQTRLKKTTCFLCLFNLGFNINFTGNKLFFNLVCFYSQIAYTYTFTGSAAWANLLFFLADLYSSHSGRKSGPHGSESKHRKVHRKIIGKILSRTAHKDW